MTLRTRRLLQFILDRAENMAAALNLRRLTFSIMSLKQRLGLRYWRTK